MQDKAPIIDLKPKEFETVKTILKQHVPEYKVVVFGSRAKQKAKRRSDLDLCLIGQKPLHLSDIAALEEAFSSSDLDMKVDVVDWGRIQTSFQEIIKRDSLIIQESSLQHLGLV
jgi:predicted nucleotidyltransferase